MKFFTRRAVASTALAIAFVGGLGSWASADEADDPRGGSQSAESKRLDATRIAAVEAEFRYAESGLAKDKKAWLQARERVSDLYGLDYSGLAPAEGSFTTQGTTAIAAAAAAPTLPTNVPAAKQLSAKRGSTAGSFPSVPQMNDTFCGPAVAYDILSHIGFSGANGKGLYSQYPLASSRYLNTTAAGATKWTDEAMMKGLNNWMADYGRPSGVHNYTTYWVGVDKITLTQAVSGINNRVRHSISSSSQAVAIEAAEKKGSGLRYNKHPEPKGEWRGHWLAVYGYGSNGETLYMADPISGVYTGPALRFSHATKSFVDNYVHNAAGVDYDYGIVW